MHIPLLGTGAATVPKYQALNCLFISLGTLRQNDVHRNSSEIIKFAACHVRKFQPTLDFDRLWRAEARGPKRALAV